MPSQYLQNAPLQQQLQTRRSIQRELAGLMTRQYTDLIVSAAKAVGHRGHQEGGKSWKRQNALRDRRQRMQLRADTERLPGEQQASLANESIFFTQHVGQERQAIKNSFFSDNL